MNDVCAGQIHEPLFYLAPADHRTRLRALPDHRVPQADRRFGFFATSGCFAGVVCANPEVDERDVPALTRFRPQGDGAGAPGKRCRFNLAARYVSALRGDHERVTRVTLLLRRFDHCELTRGSVNKYDQLI